MTVQTGLRLIWSETSRTGFLTTSPFETLKVIGKAFSQPIYFLSVEIKCPLDQFVEIRTKKYPPVQKLQGYLSAQYYFSYESDFP